MVVERRATLKGTPTARQDPTRYGQELRTASRQRPRMEVTGKGKAVKQKGADERTHREEIAKGIKKTILKRAKPHANFSIQEMDTANLETTVTTVMKEAGGVNGKDHLLSFCLKRTRRQRKKSSRWSSKT
jgi:hypothetical protein